MLDIATPAPASPTPAPQAEAAPVTPTPSSPDSTETTSGVSKLARDFAKLLTTPTEDIPESQPDKPAAKTADPKKVEPTVVEKAPAEKQIKVRKSKVPEELPPPIPTKNDLQPPQVPATPAPASTATPVDKDEFEKSLIDEEKAMLEDARSAEKYLGDKYKGKGKEMEAFLREVAKKTSDPEFDGSDPNFQIWYKEHNPKIGTLDLRQIERLRIKEEVAKDYEPRLEEERHSRWVESQLPAMKAKGDAIRKQIWDTSLPEVVLNAATERTKGITDQAEYAKAIASVQKDYALELKIANEITDDAKETIQELFAMTTINPTTGKSLKPIREGIFVFDGTQKKWVPNVYSQDPDVRRQAVVHAMADTVCEDFRQNGGVELKKDGKWFVTITQWNGMDPSQRTPFWTFSIDEIAKRGMGLVKSAIDSRIKQFDEEHGKLGYKRQITTPVAPVAPPTQIFGSPPAPRSAIPPNTSNGNARTQAQIMAERLNSGE